MDIKMFFCFVLFLKKLNHSVHRLKKVRVAHRFRINNIINAVLNNRQSFGPRGLSLWSISKKGKKKKIQIFIVAPVQMTIMTGQV